MEKTEATLASLPLKGRERKKQESRYLTSFLPCSFLSATLLRQLMRAVHHRSTSFKKFPRNLVFMELRVDGSSY